MSSDLSAPADARGARADAASPLAPLAPDAAVLDRDSTLGAWRARVLAAPGAIRTRAAHGAGTGRLEALVAADLPSQERRWAALEGRHAHLTGGLAAGIDGGELGEPFAMTPEGATVESCTAATRALWSHHLLLATGHSRYADALETLLTNTLDAAVPLSAGAPARWNPLQRRTAELEGRTPPPRVPAAPDCCASALATLAEALGGMVATGAGTHARLHLYAAGSIRIGPKRLDITTDYPWDGTVTVAVSGPLRLLDLRIPGWSAGARVTVDGAAADALPDHHGYVTVAVADGSVVTLTLPMPVTAVTPHPRIDALRGCVALTRGPVVFCLEQTDLPAGIALEDVRLLPSVRPHAGPGIDSLHAGVTALAEATVRPLDGRLRATSAPGPWPPVPGSGMLPARIPVRAIPYARWANRAAGAMRVWIPIDQEGTTT